jgi:hypothetical protein
MKLFTFIGWATFLSPFGIILAKLIGWLSWSWLTTVFVAISIPLIVCAALLAMAVWIIRKEFSDEWEQP